MRTPDAIHLHPSGGARVTGGAVACTISQAVLGEGLRWDARRGEILAVDILAGRGVPGPRSPTTVTSPSLGAYTVPGTVGAVAPVDGDPRLGLGRRTGIRLPLRRWLDWGPLPRSPRQGHA